MVLVWWNSQHWPKALRVGPPAHVRLVSHSLLTILSNTHRHTQPLLPTLMPDVLSFFCVGRGVDFLCQVVTPRKKPLEVEVQCGDQQ